MFCFLPALYRCSFAQSEPCKEMSRSCIIPAQAFLSRVQETLSSPLFFMGDLIWRYPCNETMPDSALCNQPRSQGHCTGLLTFLPRCWAENRSMRLCSLVTLLESSVGEEQSAGCKPALKSAGKLNKACLPGGYVTDLKPGLACEWRFREDGNWESCD